MGIWTLFNQPNINRGVEAFRQAPDALLIDVRSAEEYAGGHIPGSIHLPIQALRNAEDLLGDRERPLYVYCHSGARSSRAAKLLQVMGYSNVTDLGGLGPYTGDFE